MKAEPGGIGGSENRAPKAHEGTQVNALLQSADPANIALGLQLALNETVQVSALSPLVGLALFYPRADIRETADLVVQRRCSVELRLHIQKHWEPSYLDGKPSVFYKALAAISTFPGLDKSVMLAMAATATGIFPEACAHEFPDAFNAWCRARMDPAGLLYLNGHQIAFLPRAAQFPTELVELHMAGCGLRRLDLDPAAMPNLLRLNVEDNALKELPANLADFPRLRELNWTGNPMTEFPAVLARLPLVGNCTLDMKHMADLSALALCGQFRQLEVYGHRLRKLPEEVCALGALEELIVKDSKLRQLPEALSGLRQLRRLSLTDVKLAEFPVVLGNLKALQALEVARFGGAELPAELGTLPELKELVLRGPELVAWPAHCCGLGELESLDLRQARLQDLPDAFVRLISLKSLHLDHSPLGRMPEVLFHMRWLEMLSLHNVGLPEIPARIADLQRLRYLDLSGNPFKHIPEALHVLEALEVLNLSNTQLPLPEIKALSAALPRTRLILH